MFQERGGKTGGNMQNTNKARSKDSKLSVWSENVGHTMTLLEQDVLQMLVNSNDGMKGPSSCVDQITAWGWVLNLNLVTD